MVEDERVALQTPVMAKELIEKGQTLEKLMERASGCCFRRWQETAWWEVDRWLCRFRKCRGDNEERSDSGSSHGARLRPRLQEVVGDGMVEDGGDRHAHHHVCDAWCSAQLVGRTQTRVQGSYTQLEPAAPCSRQGAACSCGSCRQKEDKPHVNSS